MSQLWAHFSHYIQICHLITTAHFSWVLPGDQIPSPDQQDSYVPLSLPFSLGSLQVSLPVLSMGGFWIIPSPGCLLPECRCPPESSQARVPACRWLGTGLSTTRPHTLRSCPWELLHHPHTDYASIPDSSLASDNKGQVRKEHC